MRKKSKEKTKKLENIVFGLLELSKSNNDELLSKREELTDYLSNELVKVSKKSWKFSEDRTDYSKENAWYTNLERKGSFFSGQIEIRVEYTCFANEQCTDRKYKLEIFNKEKDITNIIDNMPHYIIEDFCMKIFGHTKPEPVYYDND